MNTTLVSITDGKRSQEYKVTIALDNVETTFTAFVTEPMNIPVMGFDIVFIFFFNTNQQIVRQVVKAVYDFRAGRSISFPIDLGDCHLYGTGDNIVDHNPPHDNRDK